MGLYLVGVAPFKLYREQIDLTEINGRMEFYAILKADATTPVSKALEHEVLLGMLKKVEGKNAALATILTFVVGSLLSFMLDGDTLPPAATTTAIFMPIFIALLVSALIGMRHLDDRNYRNIISQARIEDQAALEFAQALQTDLKYDLFLKERAFGLALGGTILAAIISLLSVSIYILFGAPQTSQLFQETISQLTTGLK